MKPLKIEVGKSYLNRLGEKSTIISYLGGITYPFRDEMRNTFTEAGRYIEGKHHEYDLVSLADETKDDNALLTADSITLRQYAAIKLRVPDSGTEWLDDMIRKSLRRDIAERAMQALMADRDSVELMEIEASRRKVFIGALVSARSYEIADAMVKTPEGTA